MHIQHNDVLEQDTVVEGLEERISILSDREDCLSVEVLILLKTEVDPVNKRKLLLEKREEGLVR